MAVANTLLEFRQLTQSKPDRGIVLNKGPRLCVSITPPRLVIGRRVGGGRRPGTCMMMSSISTSDMIMK